MLKIPLFPLYGRVQKYLTILEGKKETDLETMRETILSFKGTPQAPSDWQNPDEWIPSRLELSDKILAQELWDQSGKYVNPRHIDGIEFLIKGYKLRETVNGIFQLTERGRIFISGKENEVAREIDIEEGCIFILYLVSLNSNSTRKTFLQDWKDYLILNSNYRKESVIKDSLRRRLVNMAERGYVKREGNSYLITDGGKKYLLTFESKSFLIKENVNVSDSLELNKQIEVHNKKQRQFFKEKLMDMHFYAFEKMIKDLLEKMGYYDVQLTPPTNDKGIDVTASVEFGITSIKEVVQVKKWKDKIQRPVLDQLRGSLHRFGAVKGTIITLSDFAKGCKEAAFEERVAPITLINGEKLIDLLIQHGVGVERKQIDTFLIDNEYFAEKSEEEEIE